MSELVGELDELIPEKAVCLTGKYWDELYSLLGCPPHIGPPLILAAWWATSDADKKARFQSYLRFAGRSQKAEEAKIFFKNLPRDAWYFLDDERLHKLK